MASISRSACQGRNRGAFGRARGTPAFRAVSWGLAAAAAVAALAACGSSGAGSGAAGTSGAAGGYGGTGGAAGAGQPTTAAHGAVLSSRKLPGLGTVLVGQSGKTLYSPREEAAGKIMCTGGCLSFWFPVSVAPGASLKPPAGLPGVLGKLHRPDDGLTQLTYDGKPLYTFKLDQSPGQARGNNFTDQFGGSSFTWHALTPSGSVAVQGQQGGSSGGYPSGGTSGY